MMQRSTRSRQDQGACGEGITDRFSNLPDEIAHRILHFISFKDLIRVGTVSKRCREFYVSVPSLNFESDQVKTSQKQVELMSSLDRYLFHRGGNKLQRFSMSWTFFRSKSVSKLSDEHFRIYSWIHCAVRCSVEVLELYLSSKDTMMFTLPSCVPLSQSLKSLSVSGGIILQAPSLSFPCNLHSIELSFVKIDESFCEWISCTCKCIKEICLYNVEGIESIAIESLSLEVFVLISDQYDSCSELLHISISGEKIEKIHLEWKFNTTPDICSLDILAPNLKKFKWEGKLLNSQNLGKLMCLEEAQIFLEPDVNDFGNLHEVLGSVCWAKVLILNERTIKALYKEGAMLAPSDGILHLRMHLWSLNDALVPAVASLLRGMPKLKTLKINSEQPTGKASMSSGFDMGYWKLQNLAFIHQLEEVTVELSNGSNQIEFARYILHNAPNLTEMVLLQSGSRLLNDLLGLVSNWNMILRPNIVIQERARQ